METKDRLWVLGASDPEMVAIESLLVERGEHVAYALDRGELVRASRAYNGTSVRYVTDCCVSGNAETWYLVECNVPVPEIAAVVRIDHHCEGDPGFGRPTDEFAQASSIGQVCDVLGVPMSENMLLVAAADHCLSAAYRGECPGVDPDALMRWRATTRASFQNRDLAAVLNDVETARVALHDAPELVLAPRSGHCAGAKCGCGEGSYGSGEEFASTRNGTGDCYCDCDECASSHEAIVVKDMRAPVPTPELVEAACRYGYQYVSGPLIGPDGRHKYTVSGLPDTIRAWLQWASINGITETYGDPERGFAGGYKQSPDR